MRISKWNQYKLMRRSKKVAPHLPGTAQFSRNNFWKMLDAYKDVVIKPNWGWMGRNILHVSLIDEHEETYEIHHERVKQSIQDKSQIDSLVKKFCRNQKFVVQQKIPLASIDGCPFDIRVMVQRLPRSSRWCITGTLARIAERDYFVTNAAQRLDLVEDAIPRSSVKDCPVENVSSKLQEVALTAATSFTSAYPSCRTIGFDIGIQDNGSIWIIEANLNPMLSLFKYLDDKSMYRTIRKYHRGTKFSKSQR